MKFAVAPDFFQTCPNGLGNGILFYLYNAGGGTRGLTGSLKAIMERNFSVHPDFTLCRPGLSSKLPLRGEK